MTPFGVDIIAIPNPLLIFGKLSALEKILLPGFETLSIVFITGFPKLYFNKKHRGNFISSIFGLISLIGNFLKYFIYLVTFSKKRNIYKMRVLGIFNSLLGRQSWHRPEIN